MRLVVVSDTHVPDFAPALPEPLIEALPGADLILHAGDVTSAAVLDALASHAPVRVAMGNGDGPDVAAWGARRQVEFEAVGVRIALVHDAGPRAGRGRRMRRRFPRADLVVFGHSHIPMNLEEDGVRLFNPGSPTWKRRQPAATYGVVEVRGSAFETRIVPLPA